MLGMIKKVFLPWINAFRFFQQVAAWVGCVYVCLSVWLGGCMVRHLCGHPYVCMHIPSPPIPPSLLLLSSTSPHTNKHTHTQQQHQGVARLEMENGDGKPFEPDPALARASTNVMDVWIQASLQVSTDSERKGHCVSCIWVGGWRSD